MHNDLVHDSYHQWRRLLLGAFPTNRQRSAETVRALYRLNGEAEPYIIHCRNPFEMVVLPLLIDAVLDDSIWDDITNELFRHQGTKKFLDAWESQWKKLLTQMLNPLLSDYVRRLVDPDGYARCVAPMLETLKQELHSHACGDRKRMRETTAQQQSRVLVQDWLVRAMRGVYDRWQELYGLYEAAGLSYADRTETENQVDWSGLQSNCRQIEGALQSIIVSLSTAAEAQPRPTIWLPSAFVDVMNSLSLNAAGGAQVVVLGSAYSKQLCESDQIWPWLQLLQSCSAISGTAKMCLICDKPVSITTNDEGDVHSSSGPAVVYPGDFEASAWNGTIIPGDIVIKADTISVERINSEPNIEIRRAMIDLYGVGRYLTDSAAEVIHRDEYGVLYKQNSIVIVEVTNSTKEPDGSNKKYFLRVPPHIKRAKAAVAWTFGLREEEYQPNAQT
ncbi:MAG TPA: hypothetical protein V6C69_09985 [Trichormus sp.]